MIIYAAIFLASLLLALLFTPLTILLAERVGAVDVPASRKVHVRPIPRLGGLAVVGAVALSLLMAVTFSSRAAEILNEDVLAILAGLVIICAVGFWDDTRDTRPLIKLLFQLLAASVTVSLGVKFELASNPMVEEMRDYFDLGILAFPLSVIWIIALTNAMNLIDGLDGLATGIGLFTSLTLFLISINTGETVVPFFYIALVGATLGFLRYNRFPARVFLGDLGSMFLGYSLACLSIIGFQKSFTLSSFAIPLIIFGIPIFDSIAALSRRYLNRSGWATADREHLHHKLMDLGFTHKQTVVILYFVTALLGIIAFAFTVQLNEYAAVIIAVIGVLGGILAKELNMFGTVSRPEKHDDEVLKS